MYLAVKFLAASRRCGTQEDVRTAFEFVFAIIKPGDAAISGMFPKYEKQIQRKDVPQGSEKKRSRE